MAAPGPGLARGHEADFGHQVADGGLVEAKAGGQRPIDRILAAVGADMVRMGRQTVGRSIRSQSVPWRKARRAAWIRASVRRRRKTELAAWHRLS
jgi:hypothetical protein